MSTKSPFSQPKMLATVAVFVLWFALVFAGNAVSLFQASPGQPPLALFLPILASLVLFALAYWISEGFRGFVLSLDLRLITILQSWRVVGAGFLFLHAFNVLPGIFALPAGWGDIAIGVAAPFCASALISGKGFSRRAFATWNVLGIFDFVAAATLGTLAAPGPQGILAGEITTEPLNLLPLSLIPTFVVPLFTILHIIALVQVAKLPATAQEPTREPVVVQTA